MHDFHLADTIFRTIMDYAGRHDLAKVTKATIELGSVVEHGEEVLPDNLKFNIRMLADKTLAENLDVVVISVAGDSWNLMDIEGDK